MEKEKERNNAKNTITSKANGIVEIDLVAQEELRKKKEEEKKKARLAKAKLLRFHFHSDNNDESASYEEPEKVEAVLPTEVYIEDWTE